MCLDLWVKEGVQTLIVLGQLVEGHVLQGQYQKGYEIGIHGLDTHERMLESSANTAPIPLQRWLAHALAGLGRPLEGDTMLLQCLKRSCNTRSVQWRALREYTRN